MQTTSLPTHGSCQIRVLRERRSSLIPSSHAGNPGGGSTLSGNSTSQPPRSQIRNSSQASCSIAVIGRNLVHPRDALRPAVAANPYSFVLVGRYIWETWAQDDIQRRLRICTRAEPPCVLTALQAGDQTPETPSAVMHRSRFQHVH